MLPVSVLREGDLDFDEFIAGGDLPYPYRRVNGRVVSAYPIVAGLLNVPVYAVGNLLGSDVMARRHTLSLITASLLCAGASLFMYFALLRVFHGSRGGHWRLPSSLPSPPPPGASPAVACGRTLPLFFS